MIAGCRAIGRLTILAAVAVSCLLAESFAAEKPAATQPSTRPAVLAEFPVEHLPIIVPVMFNGQEYPFLLDSGATHSYFDVSLKGMLGETISRARVTTAGGTIERDFYYAPQAFLGKIDLTYGGKVACHDLKEASRRLGQEIRGILGVTAMRQYVVQLDFDANRLSIFESDRSKHKEWGDSARITFDDDNLPVVEISVEGRVGNAIIDTGSDDFVSIPEEFLRDVCARNGTKTTTWPSITAGGIATVTCARMKQFAFGQLKYADVIVSGNTQKLWIIGDGFLRRHTVTLDFPNLRMYLKEGKRFAAVDELNMGGIYPVREGKDLKVEIRPGGPAEIAGVRKGDVVLKIDGKDTNGMHFDDFRDILKSGDGKKIPLTVRRDEKVLEFTIVLKREI